MEAKQSLIKKIIGIEDLSQSQLDRLNLQNEAYGNLVSFLHNVIEKIQSGSTLRNKLEKEIDKLISPDLEEDPEAEKLSPNQLINLFGLVLKFDSEQSAAIINTLKESIKVNVNQNNNDGNSGNNTGGLFPNAEGKEDFTKSDIQNAKKLLHMAEKIQESEISVDEIEELIRNKKNK
jgi:hypothetical protein